jgi:hypothetical protein
VAVTGRDEAREGRDAAAPIDSELPLDDSQQYDDPSPIDDEQPPLEHDPTDAERAVEAEAEASGDIASDVSLTDREAAANDAAETTRRAARRDAVRWSARAGAGLLAAALGVGAVLGANALPQDVRVEAAPPTSHVQPASPLQSRVCAGPALRVGSADGQDALAVAPLLDPTVAVGSLGGAIEQTGLAVAEQEALSGGVAVSQRGEASTLSAAESLALDAEGARGFAASECAETSLDQWLVGGSTRTGRQSVLTVANAALVSASVDVTVFGPDGPVETVGSSGISVRPGSEVLLDLAAIAPGVSDAVIRVTSVGAPVAAHLQQTTTRGLERGGFDIVDPVQALPSAVLPGVEILEPSGIGTQPDFDDAVPALRLLSLGGGGVRLAFQSDDGTTIESEGQLSPGQVTDFPLEEIPVGTATIRIEADSPFVAGARTVAASAEGVDFDWVAGGQPRSGASAIAVPGGMPALLHVVSASDVAQEVTVGGVPVQLPAGGVVEQPVGEGSVEVVGDDLVLALTYRDGSRVGGFTVSPQGPTAEGVTVVH